MSQHHRGYAVKNNGDTQTAISRRGGSIVIYCRSRNEIPGRREKRRARFSLDQIARKHTIASSNNTPAVPRKSEQSTCEEKSIVKSAARYDRCKTIG